ncbi:MAG TPA: 3-dehydroquinate synthase [Candidatus Dormibacteraeota bacterium]|jgi:3-dehydroquinate synthase|nr:3-dehydroquinate synthase [Candidatus Dormibacteraeota bacterium]
MPSGVARVALVGLPGSGKSSVARALARRLGWRLADTDTLVEQSAGRTVAEVFAAEGEEGFRARELEALRAALAGEGRVVVACGGGLLTRPAARELLARSALLVWLDAEDSVLLRRLAGAADRPLLRDDPAVRLAALREQRAALYAAAPLRVDSGDGDVEDVCDRVADAVAGSRLTAPEDAGPALGVSLGERSYGIAVGAGVIGGLAGHLPESATRVAVVCDRAVLGLGRRALAACRASGREAELIALRGGEQVKTWSRAGRLVERLAALRLGRGDCVVVVGGGTVGDLAGFAAAAYSRGVAYVAVPTTLLAMVDSGIGGKTGVNLSTGKNLAGAFWQPSAVLCDLDALATLPERAYRAAFSEIIKYPMAVDGSLAASVESRIEALLARDLDALADVVRQSCRAKAEVVSSDERESGRRAVLNYGHTVGHALERVTGYEAMLHGEAVAAGMRVAGRLSAELLGLPAGDLEWQDLLLRRSGLGDLPAGLDVDAVVAATRSDKKARGGTVRWVLVERRGVGTAGHLVPEEAVRSTLRAALAG